MAVVRAIARGAETPHVAMIGRIARDAGSAIVVSRIARDAGKYITLSPSRLPRHRHKQSHPKMRRMAQGDVS